VHTIKRWRTTRTYVSKGKVHGLNGHTHQFRFIEYTFSPFQVKKEHYLAVKGGLSKVGDLGVAD
jgi:hypothetical protein